jgi:acetolactate synthase-1/2/3 large subunit
MAEDAAKAHDAVTIGDGGDFVSCAGRFLAPSQPGLRLDPEPCGCLGTGLGRAMDARVVHPGR